MSGVGCTGIVGEFGTALRARFHGRGTERAATRALATRRGGGAV